jgi:hypothetical protein
MTIREERISADGTRAIHTPERSKELPWLVIWSETPRHYPHQSLSAQAVGTWSTLRATNEKEEVIA